MYNEDEDEIVKLNLTEDYVNKELFFKNLLNSPLLSTKFTANEELHGNPNKLEISQAIIVPLSL